MDKKQKKAYSTWAGIGLIMGVAIGSILDFRVGGFFGISAATGAGLGIVIGSIIGHIKSKST